MVVRHTERRRSCVCVVWPVLFASEEAVFWLPLPKLSGLDLVESGLKPASWEPGAEDIIVDWYYFE
jgi:hypothetical protein